MPVLENLGKDPQPLSAYEKEQMETMLQQGRIFPNDGEGYFTSRGTFNLIFAEKDGKFRVEPMWCGKLLGYDKSFRLTKTVAGLVPYLKSERAATSKITNNSRIIKAEDVRMYDKDGSGLTKVSEGGYVLPPIARVPGLHKIGREHLTTEELLEEIKQGRLSKRFGDTGYSFERVLDLSLVGKEMVYIIHLRSSSGKEDAVVWHNGELLERERVYPFISNFAD